ncbi:hypothetical protein KR52_05785 [Synechococcus sp. KORDI-52]|nr:hypothetical protein KR52_05785 [Synechococcus sp. KORDI-52]
MTFISIRRVHHAPQSAQPCFLTHRSFPRSLKWHSTPLKLMRNRVRMTRSVPTRVISNPSDGVQCNRPTADPFPQYLCLLQVARS